MKLETRVTSNWYADVIYAALPNGTTPNDALNAALEGMDAPSVLSDALNQLDETERAQHLEWRGGAKAGAPRGAPAGVPADRGAG